MQGSPIANNIVMPKNHAKKPWRRHPFMLLAFSSIYWHSENGIPSGNEESGDGRKD
jgi:hypothetical protein